MAYADGKRTPLRWSVDDDPHNLRIPNVVKDVGDSKGSNVVHSGKDVGVDDEFLLFSIRENDEDNEDSDEQHRFLPQRRVCWFTDKRYTSFSGSVLSIDGTCGS